MKKNLFTAIMCCIIACSGVSAQGNVKAFSHVSVGLEFLSTTGFGLEVATPLSSNFAIRGGISMLPFLQNYKRDFNVSVNDGILTQIDNAITNYPQIKNALLEQGLPTNPRDVNTDVNTTSSLGLVNGKILVDIYPIKKYSFHLTAGVYIGSTDLLKTQGTMADAVKVLDIVKENGGPDYLNTPYVDGYQLTGNDLRDVKGSLKINSVKPYIGLGFGRAVPKSRIGFAFEIGAFYQGNPKITSNNANVERFVNDKVTEAIGDVISQWSIYPVVSLKINVRIF